MNPPTKLVMRPLPAVEPTSTLINITPEYAKYLLDTRGPNRRVSASRVARLANEMRAGRWRLNGETIKLDRDGKLVDGQHRLEACVQSNHELLTFFVEDVDYGAFETIDTGQSRTAADILSIYDYKYCHYLAAAVRWVETLRQGRLGSKRGTTQLTADQICRIVENEPGIYECIQYINNNHKLSKILAASYGGAFLYLIKQIDEPQAMKFMEELASGANLKHGDPALTVRDYLMRIDKRRVDSQEVLAVLIRGWKAFRAGSAFTRVQGSVMRHGERTWPKL